MNKSVVCLVVAMLVWLAAGSATARDLTFEDRAKALEAIERVYWSHRIWPLDNGTPKPSLEEVLSDGAIRAKLRNQLRQVNAVEALWRRPITAEQIQFEVDRMARGSKNRARLAEIWAALGNDPVLVAECLVKPLIADRLLREWFASTDEARRAGGFGAWWMRQRDRVSMDLSITSSTITLPKFATSSCVPDSWEPMDPDLPAPRLRHGAVWTGGEMIVWGGEEARPLGDGFRYDPATDTWTRINDLGAPSARVQPGVVWTGTEMIVWGGSGSVGGSPLGSGARYSPSSDSWTPMTELGAPMARNGHTVIWTGTRVIVWGGKDDTTLTYFGDGCAYAPSSDSWTPIQTKGAPSPRAHHSAVWSGTQMIVWGGSIYDEFSGTFIYLSTGAVYGTAHDTWSATQTSGAPSPRELHTAVWTGTEMVVWGGVDESSILNTGARYDPLNNRWSTVANSGAPAPRYLHTAVWTGADMTVWGGIDGARAFGDGGRYDPSANSWVPLAEGGGAPTARREHTAIWTGSEMIVWGGAGMYVDPTDTGGRYSPVTDGWIPTRASSRPKGREGHSAVWTGSEMIVWGGFVGGSGFVPVDARRYDPATDTWMPMSQADEPSPRRSHTAVWTGREMIVWGGEAWDSINWSTYPIQGGGRYDPILDTWAPTASVGEPTARSGHSAVWSGTAMMIWGGDSAQGVVNTGARYDPANDSWVPLSIVDAPAPRTMHVAVWSGREMIVWGGAPWASSANGARYDPDFDTWFTITSSDAPPSGEMTAVWSGLEMVTLGYRPDIGQPDPGSRYDPALDHWRPMSLAGASSARREPAAWLCGGMFVRGVGETDGLQYLKRYRPDTDIWESKTPSETMAGFTNSTIAVAGNRMIWWGGPGGGAENIDTNSGSVYCGCDGIQAVGPVERVLVSRSGDVILVRWLVVPDAAGYDLVRGDLGALRASHGDFSVATELCLVNDTPITSFDDTTAVGADGYWYLVRAFNERGPGTYESGSSSQVAPRDAEISASGHGCP